MLKFMRNKLVGVERRDDDILVAHGFLDDDLYSLEIDVSIRLSDRVIISIEGRWNRWTTPECPRAILFLQEAVGLCMEDESFTQKVQKTVSRKSCRHYANLLLECCAAVQKAATMIRGEPIQKREGGLKSQQPQKKAQGQPDASSHEKPTQSHCVKGGESLVEAKEVERALKKQGALTIDLHTHTSPASPCSLASVVKLIEEAKRIGLDGICLTDHNYVWDAGRVEDLRQKHGFLVLRGNEITTDQGDMVVFGLETPVKGIIKLDELREMVTKECGFIIVAHPFRGFLVFGVGQLGLTPQKAMERSLFRSVDGVEVLNSKVTEKENDFASQVAAGLGLPGTGGSDAHLVSEVGLFATRFSCDITNEKELLEALRTGDYSPISFRKERGLL